MRDEWAAVGGSGTFQCPITMELMQDPVMIATGHTYDRPADSALARSGSSNVSGDGGARLRHFEFIPNMAIRTAIQTWAPPEIATLRPLAPLHDKASGGHSQTEWRLCRFAHG